MLGYCVVVLNSRTVWMGIAAVWLIMYLQGHSGIGKKNKGWLITVGFTAILVALLFYKQNSTNGRVLIYKINFQLLKNHWLTGINVPYNIAYNHTQAAYFTTHALNGKEALLADNGFFAFNEYLNVFIEWGILGFIGILLAVVVVLKICLQQLSSYPKKKPIIGVVFFLLIISISSYPFHFSLYWCIFLFCIIYILKDSNKLFSLKLYKKFSAIFCIVICLFVTVKEIRNWKEREVTHSITALYKQGYFNNALQIAYRQLKPNRNNGELDFLIAKLHAQKSNLDSAIIYTKKAHQNICTDDLHYLLGNFLAEQGKLNEANIHYHLAVNIVPCRFKNRVALIQNYVSQKEYDKAIFYAKNSIELPEKVPSTQSALYKKQIVFIYNSLLKLYKSYNE